MQNRNPDKDSTLKGPITSVNTLFIFSSAGVSDTLGTGVFVILANLHIAYIIEFPSCLRCNPDYIRLIQKTQSSVPLPCIFKFDAVGTLLEFWN